MAEVFQQHRLLQARLIALKATIRCAISYLYQASFRHKTPSNPFSKPLYPHFSLCHAEYLLPIAAQALLVKLLTAGTPGAKINWAPEESGIAGTSLEKG
ncbi:MAG: hypothetical protein Q7O66_17410, partial [Dehalococcoidia bacterium]|nr:hypothetical protein [Dehalococcoidia bacterium]